MSQILDGLPFHDLSEDHLNSLQLLRVPEGPRLEFKGDLKLASNTEKRELCKDISALANSLVGYILFGVAETNGVISGIPGIAFDESVQQQLYQVLTTGITPRLQSLEHTVIRLRNGKDIVVVKVEPDGYLHQVKYEDNRYYKRTSTITIAMESSDVESFFTSKQPVDRKEEVEQLIVGYHSELRSHKYFRGVSGQGVCALVLVPEVASYKLDISNLPHNISLLIPPIYCSGWDSEVTGKALFTFGWRREEKAPYSVTEITEKAEVKAFNSLLLENHYAYAPMPAGAGGYVPSVAYERELIGSTHQYLTSLAQLSISPPLFVNCALLNVRGYFLFVDPIRHSTGGRVLQQNDVLPQTVRFASPEEFSSREAVAKVLRPAFDFIWREFGFRRSANYNASGDWDPER